MVQRMVENGVVVATIGYNLAPTVTLNEMIEEIFDAILYLENFAKTRSSANLYLCGHSAGAHLVFMALLNLTKNQLSCLKGVVLLAGVLCTEFLPHLPEVHEQLRYL